MVLLWERNEMNPLTAYWDMALQNRENAIENPLINSKVFQSSVIFVMFWQNLKNNLTPHIPYIRYCSVKKIPEIPIIYRIFLKMLAKVYPVRK